MAGENLETVVTGAADALVALFGLVVCTLRAPGLVTTATRAGRRGTGHGGAHRAAGGGGDRRAGEHPLTRGRPGPARGAGRRAGHRGRPPALGGGGERVAPRGAGRPHPVGLPLRGHPQPADTAGVDQGCVVDPARRRDLELDADDRAELLDTIYDETERLERLVTNILELSRIRAGALDVHRQPVDLARPRPGRGPPAPPARARPPHPARRRRWSSATWRSTSR